MISLEKLKILTPLQKLPKNVEELGKFIVAKGLKSCPKSNISPNLITLLRSIQRIRMKSIYFIWYKLENLHVIVDWYQCDQMGLLERSWVQYYLQRKTKNGDFLSNFEKWHFFRT